MHKREREGEKERERGRRKERGRGKKKLYMIKWSIKTDYWGDLNSD